MKQTIYRYNHCFFEQYVTTLNYTWHQLRSLHIYQTVSERMFFRSYQLSVLSSLSQLYYLQRITVILFPSYSKMATVKPFRRICLSFELAVLSTFRNLFKDKELFLCTFHTYRKQLITAEQLMFVDVIGVLTGSFNNSYVLS